PAARTLVTDHYYVAGLDASFSHGAHGVLFALENARRAVVDLLVMAGQLDDAALGGQTTAQDRDASARLERLRQRANDLLAPSLPRFGCLLGEGAAGDRHCRTVDIFALHQTMGDHRDSAGLIDVHGYETPAGLQVHEDRRAGRDAVEIVDGKRQ